jgi:peptide/nickel transport system permease protein
MAASDETINPEIAQLGDQRSRARRIYDLVRNHGLGATGALIILGFLILALFSAQIAPYDPTLNNWDSQLKPPGEEFWLGTDPFGRDQLSRLIYGSKTALLVGFTAAFCGATIGLVLGVSSAFLGGTFDLLFQRLIDILIAFPTIIIALTMVAVFGTELKHVIIAIAIPFMPDAARIVRANALSIREIAYVDAARALGFSNMRIILRHMLPNVLAPYLVILTANIGQAILLEASLSYLGLGVQEPTPAWGLMLQGGAEEYAESAPWVPIFPGLAITLAVFGFNLFGDAVRDALDPKLRQQ